MRLRAEEPDLGPWQKLSASTVVAALLCFRPPDRPVVVAIDGRGGSGKSTVAASLATAATDAGERAAVVATDDVAWAAQAFFDWDELLVERVLTPARRGGAVCLRPSTRPASGGFIPGTIEVPVDTTMLLIEGVGAARRTLAPLLDHAVWVQSDLDIAFERGITRDCALWKRTREEAETQWHAFLTEEIPHLETDRPWERADLVIAGNTAEPAPGRGDLRVAAQSRVLDGGI